MDMDSTQEKEDELQIEIVDDTPEDDRDRPRRAADSEPDIPSDEEINEYSEKVQKRIRQLKREFHEERRAKEEADRQREAALQYAEQTHRRLSDLHRDRESLRKTLTDGENYIVNETKTKVETQKEMAKSLYQKAYEAGDTDGMIKAQEMIASAVAEEQRFKGYQPREFVPSQPVPEFKPPVSERIPEPDSKAKEWVEKNPWFNKDAAMTGYVMGVHQELVSREGIDPRSDEYYERIDAAVRKVFPDKFETGFNGSNERQSRTVTVAPATRSVKGVRKVQLTASEVAVAKRLGLTPEQYANEKLRLS